MYSGDEICPLLTVIVMTLSWMHISPTFRCGSSWSCCDTDAVSQEHYHCPSRTCHFRITASVLRADVLIEPSCPARCYSKGCLWGWSRSLPRRSVTGMWRLRYLAATYLSPSIRTHLPPRYPVPICHLADKDISVYPRLVTLVCPVPDHHVPICVPSGPPQTAVMRPVLDGSDMAPGAWVVYAWDLGHTL